MSRGEREETDRGARRGFGEEQGTRVGAPDQEGTAGADHPGRRASSPAERTTGAGSEASEGVHDLQGAGRDPAAPSGLHGEGAERAVADGTRQRGSEPLEGREHEHRSGYGGAGGAPVLPSDGGE